MYRVGGVKALLVSKAHDATEKQDHDSGETESRPWASQAGE